MSETPPKTLTEILSKVKCRNCWHRQLGISYEGRNHEVQIVTYKCLAIPNHPVVFKKRRVNTTITELVITEDCELHKDPPWVTSEKFKKWRAQGVTFPHFKTNI